MDPEAVSRATLVTAALLALPASAVGRRGPRPGARQLWLAPPRRRSRLPEVKPAVQPLCRVWSDLRSTSSEAAYVLGTRVLGGWLSRRSDLARGSDLPPHAGHSPGASHRAHREQVRKQGSVADRSQGKRQMSSTPLVACAFEFPSGSAIFPSITIGLFQSPPPQARTASCTPVSDRYTRSPPPGSYTKRSVSAMPGLVPAL